MNLFTQSAFILILAGLGLNAWASATRTVPADAFKSSNGSNTNTLPASTGTLINTAPGPSGNVLTSDGSVWTSAAPTGGSGGGGNVFSKDGTGTNQRIEYVFFNGGSASTSCTSSPCTLGTHSDGVSSVTLTGGSDYHINFSPAFASEPLCVGWNNGPNQGDTHVVQDFGTGDGSASSAFINLHTSGGSPTTGAPIIHCMGPK